MKMVWKIPLFKTHVEESDIDNIREVLMRGTFLACGPEIELFEKKIANYIRKDYCLSFNSGTSALHTLLLCHNIKGGEVIIPSFTFIATANAVVHAEGRPIFAEVEEETFGLDVDDVRKKICEDTKAVILVHIGGLPARDTMLIKKLCEEKNLLLIEDAAQSFGSAIGNMNVGSFGESSIFSLCQNKIVSVGEGGLLLTNNKEIYEKAKLLRSHGRVEVEDYFSGVEDADYVFPGFNFRMPTVLASMGISQLSNINYVVTKRRSNADYLNKGLEKISEIIIPSIPKQNFYHVYQMYVITLPNKGVRDGLQKHLEKKGVMSKVYFNPVHLKTFYKNNYGYEKGFLPLTESLSERVLSLPMYPDLKREEMDYIIKSIKEYFEEG